MFLDPTDPKQFKASMFNAIVAPRPIGWISTVSADGRVNLAPFSYFNGISPAPPMVMFANNQPDDRPEKDTVANLREVPEFVVNFVSYELREKMNQTSLAVAHGVDEFEIASIRKSTSHFVRPPMVAESPANLECRVVRIVDIPPQGPGERASAIVIGRVVGVHVQEWLLDDQGRFDTFKARPLVRLGGFTYGTLGDLVEISRPATVPKT